VKGEEREWKGKEKRERGGRGKEGVAPALAPRSASVSDHQGSI